MVGISGNLQTRPLIVIEAAGCSLEWRGYPPDLRRLDPSTHQDFENIVLGGQRVPLGMPKWDDLISKEDAKALHAYIISLSWQAYNAEHASR